MFPEVAAARGLLLSPGYFNVLRLLDKEERWHGKPSTFLCRIAGLHMLMMGRMWSLQDAGGGGRGLSSRSSQDQDRKVADLEVTCPLHSLDKRPKLQLANSRS